MLSLLTCKKDELQQVMIPDETTNNELATSRNENGAAGDTLRPFILGDERPNPYSVTNMTAAWNALYPNNAVTELPTTHNYVKFSPQSPEEAILLDSLLDTLGYVLAPYPLLYEVIEEGDYYLPPGKSTDDMPEIWSVVESGFVSPITGYQIIEPLVLAPDDSYLTAKSFVMTGAPMESPVEPPCDESCGLYPYCLACPDLGCDVGTNPIPQYPQCDPWDTDWPECLRQFCDPNPPPEPNNNECGCPIPANDRQPAGCVQVLDGGLGYKGVRDVRVIVGNGWFSWRNTRTNEQGCWKTNQRIGRWNKCRVWIRFKSGTVKVHELSWRIWNLFLAITDYAHVKRNPPFNNFKKEYDPDPGNLSGRKQRNWFAALNNNGVHEFHDFASDEGILSPPPLVLTIGTAGTTSAAPMFGYIDLISGIEDYFRDVTDIGLRFLDPLKGLKPDIYSKHSIEAADEQKSVIYHEVAHASQFSLVGQNYWIQVVRHEIKNLGWGAPPWDPLDAPGHVGIAESWASHIQWDFANLHYGAAASIFNPLELIFPDKAWLARQEVNDFVNGWVPVGMWGDLMDIPGANEPQLISGLDGVSGYTNAQLFPLTWTTNFADLRTSILGLSGVTGNPPASINTLVMTGYGLP